MISYYTPSFLTPSHSRMISYPPSSLRRLSIVRPTNYECIGRDENNNRSYDIRFPEYALLLTQVHQCKILIYPGAFNLTTGPAHWELLQRARAVDGQCFVLTASPARMPPPSPPDEEDGCGGGEAKEYTHYSAWGHSSVVSPWGDVIATCDEGPAIVVADLDMNLVSEMRTAIPTMTQKRTDLYRLIEGSGGGGGGAV